MLAYVRVRGYVGLSRRAARLVADRPHDERDAVDARDLDRRSLGDRLLVLGLRAPVLGTDPHLTALPGPASIAITTTARRPTTFEAFDGTVGIRFIIRSSGLRVSSNATTVTTANTITWIPTLPPRTAVSAAARAPSAG